MPTLTRQDGAEFVMQTYREHISANKKKWISQQVRLLAKQHGTFVRLFKKNCSYEAIFSHKKGYLLGESIKQYFGQQPHLIFCETLANGTDVLLVVIRNGNIYLDTLIPAKNLRSALTPLFNETQAYDVIVSGDALRQKPAYNAVCLPPELVHSFEVLDSPLLPRLPLMHQLQLLPLSQALKTTHLNGQLSTTLSIIFLLFILLASSSYWLLSSTKLFSNATHLTPVMHSYQLYNQALTTPAPQNQLDTLYQLIITLYTLPGWRPIKINYVNEQYQVSITSIGGDFDILNQWTQAYGFSFALTPQTTQLIMNPHWASRPKPTEIYGVQLVIMTVIDQLDNLLLEKNITLAPSRSYNGITEMPFALHLKNTSPHTMVLIGAILKDLPITINHIQLKLKSGLMSGTIDLSAWGK